MYCFIIAVRRSYFLFLCKAHVAEQACENESSSHKRHRSQLSQLCRTYTPCQDMLQKTLTAVKRLCIIELISVQESWKTWAGNQATDPSLSFAPQKLNLLIPLLSPIALTSLDILTQRALPTARLCSTVRVPFLCREFRIVSLTFDAVCF